MDTKKTLISPVFGIATLLLTGALASCKSATQPTLDQGFVDHLAQNIQVSYQVDNNKESQICADHGLEECFSASLSFRFPQDTPHDGWSIYFSHLTPLQPLNTVNASVEHLNGDLHRLRFNRDFRADETLSLNLIAQFWAASRSDVPPNMYIQADDLAPRIIAATRAIEDPNTGVNYAAHAGHWHTEAQFHRGNKDNLPIADAQWNFDYYQSFGQHTAEDPARNSNPRVVPKVKNAQWSGEYLSVPGGLNVRVLTNQNLDAALSELERVGVDFSDSGITLNWIIDPQAATDSYVVTISSQQIDIQAKDHHAVGYALLTLAQLYDAEQQRMPIGTVEDGPLYDYRGMHIDIARNYNGKQSLFTLIDEMYYSKLNKLHLHFADDEGWRVEITDFPLLTELGAFRCADKSLCLMPQLGSGPVKTSAVNGFLTQHDYIELLQYAAARNIEVIPSFDIPGHARAAVQAMEVRFQQSGDDTFRLIDPNDSTQYSSIQYYNDNTLNPCLESSYKFIDTVVSRLQQLHEQANTPLTTFHMGADETAGAWIESPVCANMLGRSLNADDVHHLTGIFVKRVYQMVKARGLTLAGWSDGMGTIDADKRSDNMLVTIWTTLAAGGDTAAHDWDASPAQTVYSFPDVLYFDFPYQNSPFEPGYYWASKNTDLFKVFQFTPQVLSVHQWLWTDRMGNPYSAGDTLNPHKPTGIQGQVWSEVIRSPDTLEFMLYPRVYALGERAWSMPEWTSLAEQTVTTSGQHKQALIALQKQAWHAFIEQITEHHLPRLAAKGINFRLPPPGVNRNDDNFEFATHYPHLQIEARVNGKWQAWSDDVQATQSTEFRSRLPGTESTSRSVCYERCAAQQ